MSVRELNLTSMLDVIFLLLVFFVLTASFAYGEGLLPADMPVGEGAAPPVNVPDAPPLVIGLNSDGAGGVIIHVGGQRIKDFRMLHAKLMSQRVDRGGTRQVADLIVIQSDARVRWQHVVNAMNQCVRAKYENVRLSALE